MHTYFLEVGTLDGAAVPVAEAGLEVVAAEGLEAAASQESLERMRMDIAAFLPSSAVSSSFRSLSLFLLFFRFFYFMFFVF